MPDWRVKHGMMSGHSARFLHLKRKKEEEESDAVSIGIRGPVSIQPAFSINPVNVTSSQITKSVNLETGKDPDKKGPDTMGMKHRVDFGVYVTYGAVNVQLADKTGFSEEDGEALKEALRTLFCNDETSARPAGSMEVVKADMVGTQIVPMVSIRQLRYIGHFRFPVMHRDVFR